MPPITLPMNLNENRMAAGCGEPQGAAYKRAQRRFESLPQAIQEWAYSPQGLRDLVGSPDKRELERFVRPVFERMLDEAPVCKLKLPILAQLNAKDEPEEQCFLR